MTRGPHLFLLLLLFFWLLPPISAKRRPIKCVFKNPFQNQEKWDYCKSGDLIIGGNLLLVTIISSSIPDFQKNPYLLSFQISPIAKNYQQFRALVFAVKEINKDLDLLPNITLGFHVKDNHQIELKISIICLSLLSRKDNMVPGYKCDRQDPLLSVIGGDNPKSSRQMASIFGLFKVPQLGVGFEFTQGDRRLYPSFFRIDPKEFVQYEGLVQLLLHFQWNWIGLMAPEDDDGEHFISSMLPMLKEKEICLAFTDKYKFEVDDLTDSKMLHLFKTFSSVEVIILFGDSHSIANVLVALYCHEELTKKPVLKVWILTSHWRVNVIGYQGILKDIKRFHGALHFRDHTAVVPEFSHFLLSLDPLNPQGDTFLPLWWEWVFNCRFHPILHNGNVQGKQCTGKENLQNVPISLFETSMTGESYNIHNAVYAVAHSLHVKFGSEGQSTKSRLGKKISNVQSWQILPYLRKVQFNNSVGDEISFSENGLGSGGCDLLNWVLLPNGSFVPVKVGQLDPGAPPGQDLTINSDAIIWATKKVPFARCGMKRCQAGERRRVPEGEQVCCYQCAPCPEGTISNQTDAVSCDPCPEDQYPSKDKDHCIAKKLHFLAYQDPLGYTLASLIFSLSTITLAVLVIFLMQHDTTDRQGQQPRSHLYPPHLPPALLPLLFLFIGRPRKLTCLFQQTIFCHSLFHCGFRYLGKNGHGGSGLHGHQARNSARKLLGKLLTNSIVIACPLVQAIICTIWLATFPPFPNMDFHSLVGEASWNVRKAQLHCFMLSLPTWVSWPS
uniref:Vomeronasal type-2 receptor 26-like n=1 Tax=Laticauda laticaudata TaxID=8630 RepID=A0A8C5RQQ1_LATLA